MKNYFKKALIFFALWLVCENFATAQLLSIKDSTNFELLPGVHVQVLAQTLISDDFGGIDITPFQENDVFTFTHAAFQTLTRTKAELREQFYQVYLKEKSLITNEIYVSANRWEEDFKAVPNQIQKISAAGIALQNPQTAADMIGIGGKVFIQKSQLGGGSPMFRGFNANAVLIVVDGVRMNNCIFRSGNVQSIIMLDANNVETAEVLFGPGSVMYGSDALGGVMDVHTKKPKFSSKEGISAHGTASVRYSSANSERTGHLDLNIGGKMWASATSFTYAIFDDAFMGKNKPKGVDENLGKREFFVHRENGIDVEKQNSDPYKLTPSGYHQSNFSQKFRVKLRENMEAQYAFHYSNSSDIPRYDRLIEKKSGTLRFAEWRYGPQKWLMHTANFLWIAKNPIFDFARLTLARQDMQESRITRNFGNDWRATRTDDVAAYSLNLDLEKDFAKHQIFYGFEYVFNEQKSQANQLNISTNDIKALDTRYPSGGSTWRSAAIYGQYKFEVSPKMTFNAGLRYTSTRTHSKFTDKTFFPFPFDFAEVKANSFNGSASLVYRPEEKSKLSLSFSTGFRAPNVDDIGKLFEVAPNTVTVPNDRLRPEYTKNIEIGLSRTFGERFFLGGHVYYTLLKDMIVTAPGTYNGSSVIQYNGSEAAVYTQTNADKGHMGGFSAEMRFNLSSRWILSSTLSYVDGEDSETGKKFQGVVPMFGQSSLRCKTAKVDFIFYAKYMAASVKFTEMAAESAGRAFMHGSAERVPSWHTFNVKADWQFRENFHLNVGIENIFDRYYLPYASGIPELGRNFILSLRGAF